MSISEQNLGFVEALLTLTDDTGILQHSVYGIPDPQKGYTTDDNSRALILAVMLLESFKEKNFLSLVSRYLSFVLNAQNEDGRFKNFMNYNREFLEKEGSEDCFGRCIWALGRTISSPDLPENIKRTCQHMLDRSLANWPKFSSPRAKAYCIVGLSYLTETEKITEHIETMSMELAAQYEQFEDEDWHWFENSMTYGNAFFPWALLRASKVLKSEVMLKIAKESMDFLESITLKNGYFKPIGCKGWLMKGGEAAEYDEQPLEACESLLAYLEYFEITQEKRYLDKAVKCFCWYTGQNSKSLSLIDEETGACYDGLTEDGLNYNQGSESIVSYGISLMEISKRIALNDQLASER